MASLHTPRGKFTRYKQNAKKKKVSFELTLEQFKEFWQQPCSYCGIEIKTIGIDRVDNFIGYVVENCISCCSTCNGMKMAQSKRDWFEKMKQILNHSGVV
jgi:hypothetical protein